MERVVQQAGRAAPAVAIAGALVAVPQASHSVTAAAAPAQSRSTTAASDSTAAKTHAAATTLDSVQTRTVTVAAARQARHAAAAHSATYRVRGGDTLSKLASRFFHNGDWQYLYHENDKTISDPNLIYVGQNLYIPATAPAHYTLSDYVPRHARPAEPAVRTAVSTSPDSASTSTSTSGSQGGGPAPVGGGTVAMQSAPQGHYSCSGLEQLWEQAGGSPGAAFLAAEIAMAESGGNPNAISPTNDFGLWQVNASNGSLATLNPQANARSAVILSGNGANWGPWTTYRTGAYSGTC